MATRGGSASSGTPREGHLALLVATRPFAEEHQGTTLRASGDASGVDAGVDYVVALWPVSDPMYRFRHAQRTERSTLIRSHLAYFGD